jgi:hypothetical protein
MRKPIHQRLGAALLSLLIALSFLIAGGWHCADGRACTSGISPTCCCGEVAGGETGGKWRDATESRICLTQGACGCYRDASQLASLRSAAGVHFELPATLPAPRLLIARPAGRAMPGFPAASPPLPPRFLVSPRESRAPPAA